MNTRSFIIIVLIFFSLTPMALAQYVPPGGNVVTPPGGNVVSPTVNNNTGQNVTLINPLKGGASIESFLRSILAFVVRIGSIIVILMLVFVGYKFVTAQGEPGKISEARQMLLWTVVGALILLGAQAIASGIEKTVQELSTGS